MVSLEFAKLNEVTIVSIVIHESVTLTAMSCNSLTLLYNGSANASGVR